MKHPLEYIEKNFDTIFKKRRDFIFETDYKPTYLYVADVFDDRAPSGFRLSAMNKYVGDVFGMKIVSDYRIPNNHFYVTSCPFFGAVNTETPPKTEGNWNVTADLAKCDCTMCKSRASWYQ